MGREQGREREDMRKVKAYRLSCCCSKIIQQEFIPMQRSVFQPDDNPHPQLYSNDLSSSFFSKTEKPSH